MTKTITSQNAGRMPAIIVKNSVSGLYVLLNAQGHAAYVGTSEFDAYTAANRYNFKVWPVTSQVGIALKSINGLHL